MTTRTAFRWLSAAALTLSFAAGAQAQATRTWVSGVGDDANPCSRTAPCKTFAGAISKTAAGGEINALDPAGYGGVTITKAITINGGGYIASSLVSGTNAIIVNAGANDTIVLRDIQIQGLNTGLNGIRFLAGAALHVEGVQIQGFTQRCIDFQPSGNSYLAIKDTVIRNCTTASGGGVLVKPGAAATVTGMMDNVRIEGSTFGVRVEDRANITATRTITDGNLNNGFLAISTGAAAVLNLDHCTTSNNRNPTNSSSGIQSNGAAAVVNMTNTSIFNNNIGLNAVSSGQILSFGTNNNTNNGTNNSPTGNVAQQ